MKKNVLILSALCFAAMTLVFSGCKKETNDPQEPAQSQSYKMSITATKGGAETDEANGPRRVISLGAGGETLTAAWENGDVVTVLNINNSYTQLEGVLRAQSNGVNTLLTGTLFGTVNVGNKLLLRYKAPYYKNQKGTLKYISDNCDYATAEVTVAAVNDGVITTTEADATFQNEQAIFKFTLLNNANGAELNATGLTVNVDGDTYTVTPESATNEMYVAISFEPYSGPRTVTLTATAADGTYTKAVTIEDDVLANGQYYRITVSMTKQAAPAYKEYGPFSVSSTKRVNFSQGNLKYTKSTGKFEFMTNQYDMVETNNQNVGTDYASQNVVSLFGWATSNSNTPVANTYYYPYETDDSEGNRAKYGSGITTANVNWATAHANYDWGANTGDLGTGWRTLTKDEWVYLFESRTGDEAATVNSVADCRYTKATINTDGTAVKGIILFPDGGTFAASEFTAVGSPNTTNANYTTQCTTLQWTDLQTKGCVFLPAAGYRDGTSVYSVGSDSYYWSSTSAGDEQAYSVGFGDVNPANYNYRFGGYSVRLVKNVE